MHRLKRKYPPVHRPRILQLNESFDGDYQMTRISTYTFGDLLLFFEQCFGLRLACQDYFILLYFLKLHQRQYSKISTGAVCMQTSACDMTGVLIFTRSHLCCRSPLIVSTRIRENRFDPSHKTYKTTSYTQGNKDDASATGGGSAGAGAGRAFASTTRCSSRS